MVFFVEGTQKTQPSHEYNRDISHIDLYWLFSLDYKDDV